MAKKKMVITLEKLLEAGAHFGHQARRWNPKMAPYLYGVKDGVHVFDLAKTKEALEEALTTIAEAVKEKKSILLVGTKNQIKDKLQEVAEEVGLHYINQRWLGGTLTNFDQIRRSIIKLQEMRTALEEGEYKSLTKKERLLKRREIKKLEQMFGGIEKLKELPDLLIVLDTKRERGAILEAKKKDIPVIAIVDSNSDPDDIDYPIPMNDDATKALEYVLELIKEAVQSGKN